MKESVLKFEKSGAQFFFVSFFLFCLPFVPKISVACLIVVSILWLVSGVRISYDVIKNDKKILWFTAFYLVHLFGLLYTSNISFGLFDLQIKIFFLLAPFIFSSFKFTEERFNKLAMFFVAGCTCGIFLCLFFAYHTFMTSQSFDEFYYMRYSHFLHPTYFSMYLNFAILFLSDNLIGKWNNYSVLKRTGVIFLCYLFFINIILLSARTAEAAAFLSVLVFIVIKLRNEVNKAKKYIVSILLLTSLFLIQFFFLNGLNRFSDVKTEIKMEQIHSDKTKTNLSGAAQKQAPVDPDNSVNEHVRIWKYSFQLAMKNPLLGVGTGDIKDELINVYRENNFAPGIERKLNSHNQFLNTFAALGLLGLISLVLIFYTGFRASIRNHSLIYLSFLLMIFLNSMTESIFEVQSGILFFVAFNMLFYIRTKSASTVSVTN